MHAVFKEKITYRSLEMPAYMLTYFWLVSQDCCYQEYELTKTKNYYENGI